MRTLMWLALVVPVGLFGARGARADEEKVPLEKLPKKVMEAVKDRFPGAKLLGATTEKEDGKTVYEVSLTYKDHHHDVTLQPDGKIVSIEREIPAKDLPRAVAEALAAKYPKATYKIIEELLKAHQYAEHDIFGVRLALEEALVNAIKHGNQMDRAKSVRVA